ncbi:MAG: GNAT family N-acetyltransferase [Candidatus Asgardarchaeia archaeon]
MKIEVDEKHGYIYTRLTKRLKAFIKFDIIEKGDEKILRVLAAYTPEEFRHRGIAPELMKYTVAYAKERGLKIIPICSYAEWYFKKHKEYADILAEEDR